MRLHAKFAQLWLFACMAAIPFSAAQDKHTKPATNLPQAAASHSFTSTDGLAILGAALDSRHRTERHPDCSHFVHELYEQAGFPYDYASSSDLYAGSVDEFRRVTNPQPGDLAVWRGHVGIVVNPQQHSFFSLLRSGAGVDLYDSPYWKRRGTPHFFRYVKAVPSSAPHSPVQNANWKRPVPRDDDLSGDEPATDESDSLPVESRSLDLAQIRPEYPAPRAILVNAPKPKPDQVSAAFLEACKDWEQNLRGRDLFKSSQSLVVFDHFEVRKLHIAGNQGWAEVQIEEPVSLKASNADTHKRTEHQRWTLTRRDNKAWELTPAPNTVYLPQTVAVRLLATELADLTADASNNTQQKAQLARLLNVLLEK